MQELDVLMLRWLDQQHATASDADRAVFLRLLDTEDDKLWHWFMGHEAPPDADLDALVQRIQRLPP